MSNNTISFGNIILAQSGKQGILRPDERGYYTINAGGFNIPNRAGITYRANDYIFECMGKDSDLNRRIERGEVYCELGHPPQYYLEKINGAIVRTKIVDIFEWILRLKTIDQNNVCGHIRRIIWEVSGGRNDPIYNKIEVIPFGPFKDVLQQSLDTPDINTAFSIRTVTKPQKFGHTTREVDYFTGYDLVPEPGMAHANKHQTAGLEDFLSTQILERNEINQVETTLDNVIMFCEDQLANPAVMERLTGTESLNEIKSVLDVLKNAGDYKKKRTLINSNALSLFS